jgi:hypothetical protein
MTSQHSRWFLAGALLAVALPAGAAEVDKYLPADSEVVVSINVRQLLDAPLFTKLALPRIQEHLKDQGVQDVLTALGFDPLKDVSRITAGGPSVNGLDRGLVIVHGRFDLTKFKARAEEAARDNPDTLKVVKKGDYTMYEVAGGKGDKGRPFFVGLLNGETLVVAHATSYVGEAFDKEAGKKKGTLRKGVERLVEKADDGKAVWAVAPSATLAKGPVGKQDKLQKILAQCEALTLTVAVAEDVDTEIALAAKNPAAAKTLTAELRDGLEQVKGLAGLFAGQGNKKLSPVVDILDSTKVGAQGGRVLVKSHVGADLIEKAAKGK